MRMNKYIVEFIGTFFLVATIGFTVFTPNDAGALAPLAIGSVLMVMVFAGDHVSGAHYNPAVTLAVFLRGKCPAKDVGPYMTAQVLASLVAGFLVLFMKANSEVTAANPDVARTFIAELMYTLALCTVVLNTATAKGTQGNSFYGLAIGFTVLAGAYSVGPISGGAFNPAVAIGITLMGLSKISNIWIFLAANFVAGAVAAAVFRVVNLDDK